MSSHPLLYGAASNSRAAFLAFIVAGTTFAVAAIPAPDTASGWLAAALAGLFYAPLAINALIDVHAHVLLKNWTHLAGAVCFGALWIGPYPLRSIAAAIAFAIFFVPVAKLSRGNLLGMGDARLLVVLAGWNGLWSEQGPLTMVAVAFGAHTLFVLGKSLFAKVTLHSRHPLGPWLVGGSWLAWALVA
ncbi:hypothetical protein [Trueperella bialowiezensis]|uniref:Type IV leader peptidase family n=1 Tax=Trueperella bialowiezensis TaxID=312285 RepID=A0A448PBW3_9ACTO|nr:hypothetical protein [Trueperella bialowiezensis]VEI12455.1 Uncharacterised protein [Trueperella bialowiezensis]